MAYLLPIFKSVTVIFSTASIIMGIQALAFPIGFSRTFGLPFNVSSQPDSASSRHHTEVTKSYISLMGIRQLGTGLVLSTFALQGKWTEAATMLAIVGVVVAGTDGVFLARSGKVGKGIWHAFPGLVIAGLASAVVWRNDG